LRNFLVIRSSYWQIQASIYLLQNLCKLSLK
jgi:hypothetical protein